MRRPQQNGAADAAACDDRDSGETLRRIRRENPSSAWRGRRPRNQRGIRFGAARGTLREICRAATLIGLLASPAAAQDRVLALTTDYATGSIAALSTASPWTVQSNLAPVCADAVIRVRGGLIYAVNRMGCDNVEVIDPAGWSVIHEFSVGSGSNPQDIAVISATRAYVSRYESNDLLEVNPSTGAQLGTISLASFADVDGLCEMHRMEVRGNRLFVELQRMHRQSWPDPWVPVPPSLLAVIDLTTRQLVDADPLLPGVQGIALAGTNPIAPMQVDPATGYLLVPEAGQYGVIDAAGLERVDPVSLQSMGFVVTEAALGGDLIDFALWSANRGYALVSLSGFNTALVTYNPTTGQGTGTIYNPGGYVLSDLLVYPTGRLFLADRDFDHPGVRIYDAAAGTLLAGPLGTGLPPIELVALPGVTSQAPEDPWLVADAAPNPSAGPVRLSWTALGADRPRRIEVLDVRGRRIRSMELQKDAGSADFLWNSLDDAGRRVPSGVYWLALESGRRRIVARPVRIVR